MLSCSCNFDDDGWYYYPPNDFSQFGHKRRKRCCSCNKFINIGDPCIKFDRYRSTKTDIEERIYGAERELAPWFMCEWCGEMFFNFESLGYCVDLIDSMEENLKDYWDITGFKPDNSSCSGR